MIPDPGPALLAARDARQGELERAWALARERGAGAVIAVSANVPGPDKRRAGLEALVGAAQGALMRLPGAEPLFAGADLLGPFLLLLTAGVPAELKAFAVALEAGPGGRLLDVDIYDPAGVPVDRAALGLPDRPCLLCAEPARACIRLGRHDGPALLVRVDALLAPFAGAGVRILPEPLARQLVRGARMELDVTPKPGLVDRHDPGSHPDLSHRLMLDSIALLPRFYQDLLACAGDPGPFRRVVQAGQDAEARMLAALGTNAHKGYIFLSGLLLLGACAGDGGVAAVRATCASFARGFFAAFAGGPGHGAELRSRIGLGGIRAEAEQGLPAVFEWGWPAYRQALVLGWSPDRAGFLLMAVLMQQVEDSTCVHRGGLAALARLRRDGAELQRRLERGLEAEAWLAGLNQDYCRAGLTMGGVADCMALTFALEGCRTDSSAGPMVDLP
jgi:triphosphoribosyl-dephospho-CoA synthase